MIGDFKVTCSKMVLVCFLGNEGVFFFYLSTWEGGNGVVFVVHLSRPLF